jgi:hypothetical protein
VFIQQRKNRQFCRPLFTTGFFFVLADRLLASGEELFPAMGHGVIYFLVKLELKCYTENKQGNLNDAQNGEYCLHSVINNT